MQMNILFIMFFTVADQLISDHVFLKHSKTFGIVYISMSVLKIAVLPLGNGLNFADLILNWIFFLSIGKSGTFYLNSFILDHF